MEKRACITVANLLIYLVCLTSLTNYAQELPPSSGITNTTIDETKDLRIGAGMEIIEMGETRLVVPKGTKIHKTGSLITFEDTGEYMSRRFEELGRRLKQIEVQQEEFKKELQELHKMVDGLLKRDTTSK